MGSGPALRGDRGELRGGEKGAGPARGESVDPAAQFESGIAAALDERLIDATVAFLHGRIAAGPVGKANR